MRKVVWPSVGLAESAGTVRFSGTGLGEPTGPPRKGEAEEARQCLQSNDTKVKSYKTHSK